MPLLGTLHCGSRLNRDWSRLVFVQSFAQAKASTQMLGSVSGKNTFMMGRTVSEPTRISKENMIQAVMMFSEWVTVQNLFATSWQGSGNVPDPDGVAGVKRVLATASRCGVRLSSTCSLRD